MIRLHDRTRRQVALAIFFALGLVPTLAISAWGLWWRSARHVACEAQQLGWRLGMIASLGGVRHPAPGEVVYEDVSLREPEGRQPVFRCRKLEIRWEDPPAKGQGLLLRVALSRPEIVASHWAEIWRLVDRLLTGRMEAEGLTARLVAERLRVVGCQPAHELEQVDVRIETRAEGPWLEAVFRMAGEARAEPARLLVTRNRQRTPAATGFELDTGNGTLPCGLLAGGLPGWDAGGPASSFRGVLRVELSPDGPNAELDGQFLGVDLETLIADRLPHRLSGIADLAIERARVRHGRLVEAAGSLVAGPGMVGRSLLEVAIQRLGMAGGAGIDRPDRLVPYDRLAVWFACDSKGIRLRGLSPSGAPGTVLSGRGGAILSEPDALEPPLPLAALVQALAPDAEELIPIARQNDWRIRHLPSSPPAAPPATDNPLR